jgi:hypothetical protein
MKRFEPTTKTTYLSFFKNAKVYNMRSGIYVLGYVSEDGYNYEQQLVDIKLISDITKMSAVNFLRELKKKAINCVI